MRTRAAPRSRRRWTWPASPAVRRLQPFRQNRLRNRSELHVRRSLVDLPDFRVTPELLDGILLRVAVAAEELHGQRRDLFAHLRREELGHGSLAKERLACVLEPRGVVH